MDTPTNRNLVGVIENIKKLHNSKFELRIKVLDYMDGYFDRFHGKKINPDEPEYFSFFVNNFNKSMKIINPDDNRSYENKIFFIFFKTSKEGVQLDFIMSPNRLNSKSKCDDCGEVLQCFNYGGDCWGEERYYCTVHGFQFDVTYDEEVIE